MDFNSWNVIWRLLFGLLAFMITAGNILTIVVFLKQKLRKRAHFLLISLAVADLLVGLLAIPLYITVEEAQLSKGSVSVIVALLLLCVLQFTSYASIYTLAAISVERMYAVGWPFRHRLLNLKHYVFGIGLPWALALVSPIPLLPCLSQKTTCYRIGFWDLQALAALLVICGAYFVTWKKQRKRIYTQIQRKHDARLARTLFIVTLASLVTLLPWYAFSAVETFCNYSCLSSIHTKVWRLIALLQFSNSFVNVVIYPLRIPEFRKAIREMFPSCKNSSRNRQDATSLEPRTLRTSRAQLRTLAQVESEV